VLKLRDNQLTTVPDLSDLAHLKRLWINNNPSLECLPTVRSGAAAWSPFWQSGLSFRADAALIQSGMTCVTAPATSSDTVVDGACTCLQIEGGAANYNGTYALGGDSGVFQSVANEGACSLATGGEILAGKWVLHCNHGTTLSANAGSGGGLPTNDMWKVEDPLVLDVTVELSIGCETDMCPGTNL